MQSQKKPQKIFRKPIYGLKVLGKENKQTNKTTKMPQTKTTPSFYADEQIQAVCFIICSPVGRKLGTVFLEL